MWKQNFKINNDIYSEEILLQRVKEFQQYADIEYQNDMLIIQAESQEEIEKIFLEFMNFYLYYYQE